MHFHGFVSFLFLDVHVCINSVHQEILRVVIVGTLQGKIKKYDLDIRNIRQNQFFLTDIDKYDQGRMLKH